ncbi:uncharacterized protein B0P05DRAFT_535421 [Gilbertella persicaria]|uniref:uncharacterized protein n=1 Tax=Gilbertella persicaria TaxID=101096 RepID=UPI00221EACDC|nr:uncharacterized protein B0P05DRAFT_535421 [Gilbertella persicaria]KAI8084396.1 hypothetical protein B0P05DRAFT_535421 [Gilbertella persicaria]
MVNSIVPHEENESVSLATSELKAKMLKTEIEVQDSRSILAQLRLKGEQRISRGKRAAAAAAAAASASASANTSTNTTITTTANTREDKSTVHEPKLSSTETKHPRQPLYFQDMMLDNNTDFMSYESTGQTIDWTMFDNKPSLLNTMQPMSSDLYADHHMSFTDSKDMTSMVMNSILSPTSTRSSSLISNIGFPIVLQPSNSTHSTTSNMTTTSCSSLNSCENILQFNMEDMMFHNKDTLSNNTTMWFYPS